MSKIIPSTKLCYHITCKNEIVASFKYAYDRDCMLETIRRNNKDTDCEARTKELEAVDACE